VKGTVLKDPKKHVNYIKKHKVDLQQEYQLKSEHQTKKDYLIDKPDKAINNTGNIMVSGEGGTNKN